MEHSEYSQGYEFTQPVSFDEATAPEEEEEEAVAEAPPWGRLTRLQGGAVHELNVRSDEAVGGTTNPAERDCYTIGRNKKCDIVVDDSRVSGSHCRMYRVVEHRFGLAERLVVYLEDTSSNGTFVNRQKLGKRERRELCSGDEVTLLPPKVGASTLTALVFQNLLEQRAHSVVAARPLVAPQTNIARSLTVAAQATDRKLDADYDIREELGSGSIGKVYRAVDRTSGEHWAVKIVPTRQFSMDRTLTVDDLLGEARMLRTVSHGAIVAVRDAYSSPDFFAIVMQLVEGGDLFDRVIKRGRYSEDSARAVTRTMLDALVYLHGRGIVHRDIKPENILLRTKDDDVDALLTDFGLAKKPGSLGCTTFCGTPQYLAPEVMDAHSDSATHAYDGAAADVYSLGIVLYVLLSGTQPLNSKLDRKSEACNFDDNIWDSVSLDAMNLVRAMSHPNPRRRPAAVDALKMDENDDATARSIKATTTNDEDDKDPAPPTTTSANKPPKPASDGDNPTEGASVPVAAAAVVGKKRDAEAMPPPPPPAKRRR